MRPPSLNLLAILAGGLRRKNASPVIQLLKDRSIWINLNHSPSSDGLEIPLEVPDWNATAITRFLSESVINKWIYIMANFSATSPWSIYLVTGQRPFVGDFVNRYTELSLKRESQTADGVEVLDSFEESA